MDAILAHPKVKNAGSIELMCLDEKDNFYAKWGFSRDVGGVHLMRQKQ